MRPKTILVCLTTLAHAETLMKLAAPLARKHGAHLEGLHTLEALAVYPGIAMHVPDQAFAAFNASQADEAEAIEAIFKRYTEGESFPSEFRLLRTEAVSASTRMIECARAADLVIMSHDDPQSDRYDQREAQARVIRESGRPVLVVPLNYDGPEIGSRILLGWSDTREAARAAHDLLGLADPDAAVVVLRVGNSDRAKDPLLDHDAIDVTGMLSRHGLHPTLEHRDTNGEAVYEVVIQAAYEHGVDMIVTGAFGHSRVYDFVIGATTYGLLGDAHLPVLFSK